MKGKFQVLNLWLVFTSTRLMHMKVASFKGAMFYFLRCAHGTKLGARNPNLDDIPTSKHENKIVHHVPPKNELSPAILQVRDVPTLGYGHVYFIKSNGGVMSMTYEVTIGVIPNCTCFDFVISLTNLHSISMNSKSC